MDKQREKDVQDLCQQILEMPVDFWDNPYGAYENSCPFCGVVECRSGGKNYYVSMSELKHNNNCAFLIAKDLSTNY